MSDIRFDNAMDANTNVETEHAHVSATGASHNALHAHEGGASYDGSLAADASYSAHAPELPETPDVAAEARATVEATVHDATARADGALEAAGGLPELPETDGVEGGLSAGADASVDGTTGGVDVMIEGWLDALGELAAHVSGSVSAALGL